MLISLPSIRSAVAGFAAAGLLSGALLFGAAQLMQTAPEPAAAQNLR